MDTKESIRAKIFNSGNSVPEKRKVVFFDAEIEVRQPSAGDVVDMANTKGQNMLTMLVQYSYVPDTSERVFTEADIESLRALRFSADFSRLAKVFEELTDIDIKAAEGN